MKKPQPASVPWARRLPSWWPLVLFMILGAWARFSVTIFQPIMFPDTTQYLSLAREIGSGAILGKDFDLEQGFGGSRKIPPLYSLLIAPFTWTGLDLELVGTVISLVLSVLTMIPLYWLAQLLFGRRAAVIAGMLFVLHPFTLYYAGTVLTESTFAALYLTLILAVTLALDRPTLGRAAATGVLAALLTLTRDVGLVVLPLVLAAVAVRFWLIDRIGWRPIVRTGLVFLAAFILVSLPWLVHIRARTGHFGLTIRMENSAVLKHFLAPTGGVSNESGEDATPETIGLAERALIFGDYGRHLAFSLKPTVAVLALGMILAGAIPAIRRGRRDLFNLFWLPAWIVLLWAAYALLTAGADEPRYLYPLMAPGVILAAAGADRLAQFLSQKLRPTPRWSSGRIYLMAAAILCLIMTVDETVAYAKIMSSQSDEKRYEMFASGAREAANDLIAQGLVPPGAVVMDRKPFLPYYLSARWYFDHASGTSMPSTLPELEDIAAAGRTDYIVADSFVLRVHEPRRLDLAFGLTPLTNCRVIYSRDFPVYQRVITVYKVGEPEPSLPPAGTDEAELAIARDLESRGQLLFALRRLDRLLARDPDSAEAWFLEAKMLSRFYECARIDDTTPTMAFVPGLLPALENTAAHYVRLHPNHQAARQAYLGIRDNLAREKALMEQPKWKAFVAGKPKNE